MALDSFNILDTDLNVVVCIANTNFTMTYLRDNYHKFLFPYYKILGSESFARWLISRPRARARARARASARTSTRGSIRNRASTRDRALRHQSDISLTHCHHISQSLDLPLPPHQSVI